MRYAIASEDLIHRVLAAKRGEPIPKGGKHILIACMPKSGSTFLAKTIGNIPGMFDVTLSFGYERREQELCLVACSLAHELNYVAQHHVRYSTSTQKIMDSFGIFPVVLMRSIFDCVVSLRDHLEQESTEIPIAYLPPQILHLPKEKQYDLLIDLAVPWYANFFACWAEYKGPCMRIFYRDMVEDFQGTISAILRAAGMDTSPALIDRALTLAQTQEVRFNVGRVGRGTQELTPRQIDRIQDLFSNYSDLGGVEDILYRKAS
jgi:hypothetical protein